MTLVWGLYMTIWLPYLDSRRSYRSVAESLASFLPADGCVASRNLGEPQRALFDYFANLVTVREERCRPTTAPRCWCSMAATTATPAAPAGWEIAWEGRRRGDDTERFVLFRKDGP